MKRSKTRTKTLDPAAAVESQMSRGTTIAPADLHAKLDALMRANSPWLPLVTNTIESAYKDMPEPLLLTWVN